MPTSLWPWFNLDRETASVEAMCLGFCRASLFLSLSSLSVQVIRELAALDEAFGRFIAGLKERGLYENSMIVVTSDHGEQLGEQGLIWHRVGLHEPSVRVPLLIRYPGSHRGGARVTTPVDSRGILPTVLHTLEKPIPDSMRNRLLDDFNEPVILEEFASAEIVSRYGEGYRRDLTAVRDGDKKIIMSSVGVQEIYGLTANSLDEIAETDHSPELGRRMSHEAAQALAAMQSEAENADLDEEMTPEVEERLRALGYID